MSGCAAGDGRLMVGLRLVAGCQLAIEPVLVGLLNSTPKVHGTSWRRVDVRWVMNVFCCTFGGTVLGGRVAACRFGVYLEGLRTVVGYQLAVLSALVLTKFHSKNACATLF